MAELLALLTLYCKVPGSNFDRGGVQLMTVWHFIAQTSIITPLLPLYDLNNVEIDLMLSSSVKFLADNI